MKTLRAAATALMFIGLVLNTHGQPALASPSAMDVRFQTRFQEAYRMLHRGAETGDSELLARGQKDLQDLLAELEAAVRSHPRDAKLKELLGSALKTSGASLTLDGPALDALDKQLALP